MTDFRALCQELASLIETYPPTANAYWAGRKSGILQRARAELAKSEEPLARIAVIAHAGGLIGFPTETAALNEIRRLTQPFVGDQINQLQSHDHA